MKYKVCTLAVVTVYINYDRLLPFFQPQVENQMYARLYPFSVQWIFS